MTALRPVEFIVVVLLIVIALLLGFAAFTDIKALKTDVKALKALTRAQPAPTECKAPGVPQARICNYSLVVEHIEGDYYMGYVNRAVVEAGEAACEKIEKELQQYYTDFKCAKAKDYEYNWYGFKIEGAKPPPPPQGQSPQAYNYINLPNTGSLKLGTVHQIKSPASTTIDKEYTDPLMPLK